jgi:pyruvate/2-oxoglutarate dehydrogenase complex dihydrolipoamide acyltransferase (E2) component
MNSPYAGTLTIRLKPGDEINPGTLLAHIAASGQNMEVRSDVPGTIDRWIAAENAQMQVGQPLVLIKPSQAMVWEALRALYLIGRKEDLVEVTGYARAGNGEAQDLQQQATLTAQAINARANTDHPTQQNR